MKEKKVNNLEKQMASLFIGISFTTIITFILLFIIQRIMLTTNLPKLWITVSLWITGIMSIFYFGIGGLILIKPVHSGVVLFLGSIIEWFTLPSGYSWILPKPLMNFIEVDTREETKDHPLQEVLSRDNSQAEIDVQVQRRVIDPVAHIKVEDAEKSLDGLVERNVRWLGNLVLIKDLPGVKNIFSKILEGEINLKDIEETKVIDMSEIKIELGESLIKKPALDWGYEISKILVKDIRIPKELTNANVKKMIEEAEKLADTVETDNLISNVKKIAKELEMSTSKAADLFQAEREKATRTIIDGTADPLVKAGKLAGRRE